MQIGLRVGNIAVTEEGREHRKQRTGILPGSIEARQRVSCERMANIVDARQSPLCRSPPLFLDEAVNGLSESRFIAAAAISVYEEWITGNRIASHFGTTLLVL
jgi:hypothetical protein